MEFDRYILSAGMKEPLPDGSYLRDLPVVQHLEHSPIEFKRRITFIVGENGSGKSTLVEGIASAFGFNPEGGSLNYSFETRATHSELWRHLRLSKLKRPKDGFFLRAESFYNASSYLEELDEIPASAPPVLDAYGGVSLHKMSHGEGFLKLVQNRFYGNGLYILDEPEAALSPMKIMTLICEIDRLAKADSQFIIATHSPMLMAMPDAEVLFIDNDGVSSVDYRETEHFLTTKLFLEDPDRMLGYLLR